MPGLRLAICRPMSAKMCCVKLAGACAVGTAILCALLAALVGAAIDLRDRLLNPTGQALADLDHIEATWRTLGLDYYRATFESDHISGRCRQIVDVLREQIVSVIENGCGISLMTVTQFLEKLRARVQIDTCLGASCECIMPYTVVARFDAASGLPERIGLSPLSPTMNPDSPLYWESLVVGEPPTRCARSLVVAASGRTLALIGVRPLSQVRAQDVGAR